MLLIGVKTTAVPQAHISLKFLISLKSIFLTSILIPLSLANILNNLFVFPFRILFDFGVTKVPFLSIAIKLEVENSSI